MHILLGVNGVIIKNKRLLEHLHRNTETYVRRKNMYISSQALKKYWGHVVPALKELYPHDDFSDFQHRVYTKDLLHDLNAFLKTEEFDHSRASVTKLLNDCGHSVTLFSNSPLCWTAPIAYALDSRVDVFSSTRYKPHPYIYNELSNKFRPPYIYIDDTLANLEPVRTDPDFIPFHMNERLGTGRVPTIQSLNELTMYLS